jgi:hypothetical protein
MLYNTFIRQDQKSIQISVPSPTLHIHQTFPALLSIAFFLPSTNLSVSKAALKAARAITSVSCSHTLLSPAETETAPNRPVSLSSTPQQSSLFHDKLRLQ